MSLSLHAQKINGNTSQASQVCFLHFSIPKLLGQIFVTFCIENLTFLLSGGLPCYVNSRFCKSLFEHAIKSTGKQFHLEIADSVLQISCDTNRI
jgi:hypothetical protein